MRYHNLTIFTARYINTQSIYSNRRPNAKHLIFSPERSGHTYSSSVLPHSPKRKQYQKMYLFTLLLCLFLSISPTYPSTIPAASHFCYTEASCAPSKWPGVCTSGKQQSPIRLPSLTFKTGDFVFDYGSYKGSSFRMSNNGHSVSIDFVGQSSPTNSRTFAFPDPLSTGIYTFKQNIRQYKLASIHFHWGTSDLSTGSEHCIGNFCGALEIHFVHYLANYKDQTSAVNSNDPNALAVLGVLVDVNPARSILGIGGNLFGTGRIGAAYDCFAPIVRNLKKVEKEDAAKFVTINEPIDFTSCAAPGIVPMVYSYKGSLTTPGCNEIVNWYVMKYPATASHQDLQAFRTILKDGEGETLMQNHRPLQSTNGRTVRLSKVIRYNGAVLGKMFG